MPYLRTAALVVALLGLLSGACSRGHHDLGSSKDPDAGSGGTGGAVIDAASCASICSDDGASVVDSCSGKVEAQCAAREVCHDSECRDACALADESRASVGCDYYAVNTDILLELAGSCFVAFVTNTFHAPAHLEVSFDGNPIDLAAHVRLPSHASGVVTYEPFDPAAGLPPGRVALLFLSNAGGVRCPVPAARTTGAWVSGTGRGEAFRIESDVPVVAFQMLPYGGGSAAITGASLLLPTSAWSTDYIAVNAWSDTAALPSLDIVAAEDDTTVVIRPKVAIEGRSGLVAGTPAEKPVAYTLQAGEFLQLSQSAELTGSLVVADKPIALFGGNQCMYVPDASALYCDHAEQQIPPVQALGHEYAAAHYRPRAPTEESFLYRLVGVVDITLLSYDPPIKGAPSTIARGEALTFYASEPFVVGSQDKNHPFMLFSYMTGSDPLGGFGDPEFVRVVTPEQYLRRYVFFTDPTYPETNLVVIRKRKTPAVPFADVTLDCAGKLDGWQPLGTSGLYEYTRADLMRGDFEAQGACTNGVQQMRSDEQFGVYVWSWGGPETSGGTCGDGNDPPPGIFTCNVSYGYAAGESVLPVNDIDIGPIPR